MYVIPLILIFASSDRCCEFFLCPIVIGFAQKCIDSDKSFLHLQKSSFGSSEFLFVAWS
jgi:hypothetical protein